MTDSSVTTQRAWAILLAMGLGALIAQMFSTVIGPALPTIKAELDLNFSGQTWTVTAYSLGFGAALVAGGRLTGLVGEVRLIVIGYAVFGAGLVASALATDGLLLIAGRGIQGIGIGISAPATLSIVVNTFPVARRGMAVGLWGAAHGLGLLLGPLVAGYLVEVVSWRWIFWVAVPLTLVVIAVTLAATRGYPSTRTPGRFDVLGLVLGASGITALVLGLQYSSNGWAEPMTIVPIVLGVALLVAFFVVQTRIADPLIDLSLFRKRMFAGAFFSSSMVGFAYIPMLTFVGALYLIGVLGMSPVEAGWVIMFTTATTVIVEPLGGRWVDAIGPRVPMVLSLALFAVGLGSLVTISPESTVAQLAAPLIIVGVAVGIALAACNTAAMSSVDTDKAGMASGLIQMTFNLPAAIGVAVVTSLVGTLALARVEAATAGSDVQAAAMSYQEAIERGDEQGASAILEGLTDSSRAFVQEAVAAAEASTIGLSMAILGFLTLLAAVVTAFMTRKRVTS